MSYKKDDDDGRHKIGGPRVPKLGNSMSVQYLKEHLNPVTPRMILTPKNEELFLEKLKTDPVLQNMKKAIHKNVQKIKVLPLVEHKCKGKRMLEQSREMLYRMNVLCMHYYMHNKNTPFALDRINQELLAVCNFCDWNPKHFLDIGEMCMAVSLALDWVGHELPEETVTFAKQSLIEKGIMPSYTKKQFWMEAHNNWNQVCHGGLIAASIAVADVDPELAAKTIKRALNAMPYALNQYGPDGVYPEGPAYWEYGTSYTALASSILETSFGTDFGIANYPSFQASATFRAMSSAAPTGWFYNFSDCADRRSKDGDLVLAWFAAKCGNRLFYEEERFLRNYNQMGKLNNLVGAGILWLAQFEPCTSCQLPSTWRGGGCNPVVFFTAEHENDDSQFYFAAKGGRASNSHANMDGGSFVFELDGVRWVVDPGSQQYGKCEDGGIDLWNQKQDSSRWTLLTKNNFGHSTITVDDELHKVDGMATVTDYEGECENPMAEITMTAAFGGKLKKAVRRFTKDSSTSLIIEDELELTNKAEVVTWQLMTKADVSILDSGALLTNKDGEESLHLELLSEPKVEVSIVELDPPPLALDRPIEGLKRIELRFPASAFEGLKGKISVRLSRGCGE